MKHIYKVIYDLSLDLVIDVGLLLKVQSRSHTFKGLCLVNGASYDNSLYEMHTVNDICPFTFDEIERSNQGHWVFRGIYFTN